MAKKAARTTPKQRTTAALQREIKATKALKKAKPGSAAYKKAQREIKLAQRIQKRGYTAARNKIKSADTGKKVRTKDAIRKGSKKNKKSSAKGKKTKATSKKTRTRSSKGKRKR